MIILSLKTPGTQ